MSKIFEALERAKQQSQEKVPETVPTVEAPVSQLFPSSGVPIAPESEPQSATEAEVPVSVVMNGLDIEGEMITLYQTIDSLLPDISHKVIQVIGSRSGEGTSTVARELAKVVSLKLGKQVLLVDLDRSRPELKYFYNIKSDCNLEEIIKGNLPVESAFSQVGEDSLYVSPLFQQSMVNPRALDGAKSLNFWEELRRKFDFIIIDSPPATLFSDGLSVARLADGVVLVVEAEKTSWPIVLSVKEKIIQHGGNILGIVFNRRKYYIPQFIYKRL